MNTYKVSYLIITLYELFKNCSKNNKLSNTLIFNVIKINMKNFKFYPLINNFQFFNLFINTLLNLFIFFQLKKNVIK